jgi:hypothetical protein
MITNMTTQLRCPLVFEKTFLQEETYRAIAKIITPFDKATNGDVVAFGLGLQLTATSATPVITAHTTFYLKVDNFTQAMDYRVFRHRFPDRAIASADAAMTLLCDLNITSLANDTIHKMDQGDGENLYLNAILTPDAVIVTYDDMSYAHDFATEEGFVHEDNIDKIIGLVAPNFTSSHEKMEFAEKLPQIMRLISSIVELIDKDGSTIDLLPPSLA